MNETGSEGLLDRSLLTLGFACLTLAVFFAHTNPATGYELSIYSGTPAAFWLLIGCAALVSLVVALRSVTDRLRRAAIALGGVAAVAFVGLPIVRGYRYFGTGDALTHLGWIRGIRSGAIQPTELRYVGIHTISTLLSVTFGIDVGHGALLLIALLSGVFFLFVSLSASIVYPGPYSSTVGAFSAFLLLPITGVSTFLVPHSMSQAILFSSVAIYLVLRYVRHAEPTGRSGTGAALSVALVATVLFHPQLAAHLLAVFFGIALVQFLYRRFSGSHPIASHRLLLGQTVVLGAAFLAWSSKDGFFQGAIEYAARGVYDYLFSSGSASDTVSDRGTSLAELGSGIAEVFLKMFGPSVVFLALTGILVVWTAIESDGALTRKTDGLIPYFTVTLVGLVAIFAVYFFGSYGEMYFRVLGLILVFVTIAGAVAIAHAASAISRQRSTAILHSLVAVGFVVLLAASLIAVFPSPYLYNSSPHVTEKVASGHESAFGNQADGHTFVGIRAGPNRHADATNDEVDRTREYESISGEEIDDGIDRQFDDSTYLVVTEPDHEREVTTYRELRYTRSQLDSISAQRGVSRVQANGEFELYYVRGAAD